MLCTLPLPCDDLRPLGHGSPGLGTVPLAEPGESVLQGPCEAQAMPVTSFYEWKAVYLFIYCLIAFIF